MYSQQDLNEAVAAGAITADAADALRAHVAAARQMPVTDEENFRLFNSFNDIFVAIGVVIMLLAAGAIGQAIGGSLLPALEYPDPDTASEAAGRAYEVTSSMRVGVQTALAGLLVAATSWGLAEFFTRRRRMALPSILLLIALVGGVFATCAGTSLAMLASATENMDRLGAALIALSGLIAAGAAFVHWRRFMVPITVAAGAAGISVTVVGLILAAIGPDNTNDVENVILAIVFVLGLAVFAYAMRWDTSDRARTTRRSDVAFWLHLLAAPMIAHPIFYALGVMDNSGVGIDGALAVLAVYVVFGLVALAVDRRALLVSALAYVLVALTFLFDEFGAVELNFALTALVIGSALLTLSAFWSPIRSRLVGALPGGLQERLPLAA